ncbi:MAG: hypothetical protein ACI4EW_09060 [Butyrivibrio sp.]
MHKRIIGITIAVVATVAVLIIGFLVWRKNTSVNMDFAKDGKIVYISNNLNINEECKENELSEICNIFNGKILYKDDPACGFSEEISIKINEGQTFCPACDSCPVVYWKEKNRYFRLSDEEIRRIHEIFESYGAVFPCI